MKFRFNIGSKLWLGFGLLLGSILISGAITYGTLINTRVHDVATPSLLLLKDLRVILNQSEKLISVWINTSSEDIVQKNQLSKLHNEDYPIITKSLKQMSKEWDPNRKVLLDSLLIGVDSVLRAQHTIMIKYDEKESYLTPEAETELEALKLSYSGGDRFEKISFLIYKTERLIKLQEDESEVLRNEMQKTFYRLQNYVLFLGLFFFLSGAIIAGIIISSIVTPINKLKELLNTMGQGVLPNAILEDRKDEIGHINRALMNLISGLKSIVSFSKSIGNGNFDVNFKPLSSHDDLGNNLLLMRNNLKKVAEDDFKRNWTTGGLAKFSELLRMSSDNVTRLSENLIMDLVRYLDANQGGVFVINDNEVAVPFLEMKGCYAWDRQKFIDQKIFLGDGLIGQCWQERDTIYVTDVPDNYIRITSGLGKALPKSILLVPMVANDIVFGVIEIASFKLFEKYEIDFVEHLAQSTATTISSAKVNERTKSLLDQAQYSSKQLKIHEEEMEQKQSEIKKNQEKLTQEIDILKKSVLELTHKNNHLKDENDVLQNLILKFKKEIDSE
jgi:putative methionine-R-sulfoxide reductase with GAF domain